MGDVTLLLRDESELVHLAQKIATKMEPGDRILLHGELGAGKTTFVKALVAALGSQDEVTSPTFGLIHGYTLPESRQGHLQKIMHMDAYRLTPSEAESLDLSFYEQPGTGMIIEWAERFERPMEGLHLYLSFGQQDTERKVEVVCRGEMALRFKPDLIMQD